MTVLLLFVSSLASILVITLALPPATARQQRWLEIMRALAGAVGFAVLMVSIAGATSVVLPPEDDYVASADVIASGKVEQIEAYETPAGTRTRVSLRVEEAMRGANPGDLLAIVELGGVLEDGSLVLEGNPPYRVGERALVLLTRREDGSLRTSLLAAGRIPLEVPWWSLGFAAPSAEPDVPAVADWQAVVAEKALALPRRSGVSRAAPASLPEIPGVVKAEAVRTMGARWRRADPIPAFPSTVPDAALGLQASDAAFLAALQGWNGAGADIRLEPQGTRRPPAGFAPEPGGLVVSFNDPRNEIEDPRNCSGVLAIGGFSADGRTQGDGLQTITGAALVFNNGWDGCGFWAPSDFRNFSEVFCHEVGHNLGLDHSCRQGESCNAEARAALMNWSAAFDGRGATPQTHDVRSIRELYGTAPVATAVPSPSPSRSPAPTNSPNPVPTAVATASPRPSASPPPGPLPTPRGCKSTGGGDALFVGLVLLVVCVAGRRRW